jgi:hypothetical protein
MPSSLGTPTRPEVSHPVDSLCAFARSALGAESHKELSGGRSLPRGLTSGYLESVTFNVDLQGARRSRWSQGRGSKTS